MDTRTASFAPCTHPPPLCPGLQSACCASWPALNAPSHSARPCRCCTLSVVVLRKQPSASARTERCSPSKTSGGLTLQDAAQLHANATTSANPPRFLSVQSIHFPPTDWLRRRRTSVHPACLPLANACNLDGTVQPLLDRATPAVPSLPLHPSSVHTLPSSLPSRQKQIALAVTVRLPESYPQPTPIWIEALATPPITLHGDVMLLH